jgi:tetratricopeptide (TPR) repeat protein
MRVVARAVLLALGLSVFAVLVHAQQPRRRSRATPAAPSSLAVRAELASVLLQSGRYDEAAREFRLLLSRDPGNFDYRLGLAHALAWGDHPREAEGELVQLIAKRPSSPGLDSLLRAVRDAYDPRAVDAAQWVASDPTYAPYRLALARALVREKMYRLAIVHFDTLLSRPGVGRLPDRGALLRETADAYIAAGDRAGGAGRLRAALAFTPLDTALRHSLAVMLVDARQLPEARAQYDTLIDQAVSGALLAERAQLRLSLGERGGAESDLWASVRLTPSSGAFVLLGDLYRERGDYRGARSMYVAARQGASTDVRVAIAGALAQIDREERPAILAPLVGDDPGWRLSEDAAGDNLGVVYSALAMHRTLPLSSTTRVSLGAEWRQLGQHTAGRRLDASGYGATIGGWQEASYGPLLARVAVEGGGVYHPLAGTLAEGSAALAAWIYAWQANLELSTAPAYPSLFSIDALLPPGGGAPLTERDVAVTLGGPAGPLDVGGTVQRSILSDDNRRLTMEGYLRYPLGGNMYAVYAASGAGFAHRSSLYWDPARYATQSAGIEYAIRRARGLSFAARVLPSYATSDESAILPATTPGSVDVIRGPIAHHSAVQLGAAAEAGYRVHGWEAAGALSYGRGRAGDYQRVGASITVRMLP